MKIVFLARLFYPHIGGVEKHVMEISKKLIKNGHSVTVITEQLEDTGREDQINGIHIYKINGGYNNWYKKFWVWKDIWSLKSVIRGADVVHAHDVFFWYLPFRFFFWNKRVYTTFHGYESYPISKRAILMRKISEKLSWGNICIGDFIKKWYHTKPTVVSYGGVDIPKGNSSKYKPLSAIFIGRLDEQTGILTYAKAIELLKKKNPKFDFLIVGDGTYRNLIAKKFNVHGFQKDPEKYFPKYHFAFVSRYLSILEAFAAKRLVFAVYDNPVKEDYLKMTPYAKWIIIEKDPKKLADKVTYYMEHPKEEKEMTDKAFLWVREQTWEKMVEIYLSLWRRS